MKHHSASIGRGDLADALKAAVTIEQQRLEKLSQVDLDAVAGGLTTTSPIIISGPGSGTGTVGAMPPPTTDPTGQIIISY